MMVCVGFLSALLTKGAASATNRFFDLVRLAELVQRARLRIVAHPDRANLVNDRAAA